MWPVLTESVRACRPRRAQGRKRSSPHRMSTDFPSFTSAARMTASLVLPLLVGLVIITVPLRKWRSGSAIPCQGIGRGFESRLPLRFAQRTELARGSRKQVRQRPPHTSILAVCGRVDPQGSNLPGLDVLDRDQKTSVQLNAVHRERVDLPEVGVAHWPRSVGAGRSKVDAAMVVDARFALHASKPPMAFVQDEIVAMVPSPRQQLLACLLDFGQTGLSPAS
jgi:hypothetical protein